jgi:hypothetical protein
MRKKSQDTASAIVPRPWWLGLAVGVAISSTVTVIIVIWEWLENPGGIFRGDGGTNWGFVFDTAISWFVPTFVYAALFASALHLAWSVARAVFSRLRNRPDPDP